MHHENTSDRESSASWGKAFLCIGIAVLLPVIYFLACPWLALFAIACFPALSGDNALAKALEWSLYPAMKLAENFEPYGDYFWGVLQPLGG